MKKFLLIASLVLMFSSLFVADVVKIEVSAEEKTGTEVPYRVYMHQFLDMVSDDFDANWYSLRIVDSENNELDFQIDDLDSNGKISSEDLLTFLFKEKAYIVISDDPSMDLPEFTSVLTVEKKDANYLVNGKNISGLVKIDDHGFANYVENTEDMRTVYGELGIFRVAGWKGSTFWIDGSYGNKHEEKTSYNFDVEEIKFAGNGAIGATFVSMLESKTFPGMKQKVVTTVLKTGETLVDSKIIFENYADMMKLQLMSTKPLTDVDQDSVVHVMPVFRRMVWSEQINGTPYEYWLEREAVEMVNSKPYLVFPATDSMKPLWWGATYIFASEESWRANYSENLDLGVFEILPEKPLVLSDFEDFVYGNTWVYESREFRDGVFRWIPGEFEAFEATKGNVSLILDDWPLHCKAGDEFGFVRLYGTYETADTDSLIEYLEARSEEFQSVITVE